MLTGRTLSLVTLLIAGGPLMAQESDLSELTDILKVNTKMYSTFQAASGKALPLRESPGIVSLITRDEIVASGARDLLDLLKFVPGLDFGVDVEGAVGIGVRGSWAHEGKALLLLDGIEMNETLNGTTAFGGHFPADSIERIEIIRGPGSALYGGFAELAVINVITRSGGSISGFSADLSGGHATDGGRRRQGTLAGGGASREFEWSVTGSLGSTQRSGHPYTDLAGQAYDMNGQSDLLSRQVNVGLKAGGFTFRGLLDRHSIAERDHYGEVIPALNRNRFNTQALRAAYELPLGEKAALTLYGSYKEQTPWTSISVDEASGYWRTAARTVGGASFRYEPSPFFSAVTGAEYTRDRATENIDDGDFAHFQNQALFAQAIFSGPLGTLTAGGRWEKHSQYGSSFAPRLAWTKAWTLAHIKLLAAKAFRAPTFENLKLNREIRPEKTTTLEAEVGFNVAPGMYLSVNLFDNAIKDPIVYAVVNEADSYQNESRTGTRGAELNGQWSGTWGSVTFSYAYNRPHQNEVLAYAVPGRDQNLLGLATRKATLQAILNLGQHLSLAPSLVHGSSRYGFAWDPAAGEGRIQAFGSWTDAHLFLRYAPQGDRWALGLGVYNAFNTAIVFLQPYDGGHAPLPSQGREVALKLSFNL